MEIINYQLFIPHYPQGFCISLIFDAPPLVVIRPAESPIYGLATAHDKSYQLFHRPYYYY